MATSTIKKQTETPLVLSIPTGQWSGSGSDYYITVTASNVTANSILVPHYDNTSAASLNGPVWCVPAEGSFTVHTSAIPSGTVNIMVQFVGTLGEAQYQVLADVYSRSQVDSKIAQSTANTLIFIDVPLTLTDDLTAPKEYTVNVSSYIPSGYVMHGVTAAVSQSGSVNNYTLPWANDSWEQYLKVQLFSNSTKAIVIKNKSNGWGTVTLRLSIAVSKS